MGALLSAFGSHFQVSLPISGRVRGLDSSLPGTLVVVVVHAATAAAAADSIFTSKAVPTYAQ